MLPHRYRWRLLQPGRLPLAPDGSRSPAIEHACTVTLVWPAGEPLTRENSIVVDPCFSSSGVRDTPLGDIGHYFVTHPHHDHLPSLPAGTESPAWKPLPPGWPGISTHHCPGHYPSLRALRFCATEGEVWIAGDAVINEEWLRSWAYYWPNRYDAEEIVQTWRSVANILSSADVVIPGHGDPIAITDGLIADLIDRFPQAAHATDCPDVEQTLRRRLGRPSHFS